MYDHSRRLGGLVVRDEGATDRELQQCLQALEGARALRERSLEQEIVRLRRQRAARVRSHNLIGKSPRMQALLELVDSLGYTTAPVLIEGETGTGKQQVARAVHEASVHRPGRFIAIGCAVQPVAPALQESMARAQHGSLYLGELGSLPSPLQSCVLSWLQEGSHDVRLLAGSSKSLQRLMSQGVVLPELWDCLQPFRIALPPLRKRPEDIVLLAQHFAGKHARPQRRVTTITAAALERLLAYRWPGNIRELETVILRACFLARGGAIAAQHLPAELGAAVEPLTWRISLDYPLPHLLRDMIATIERQYLRQALRQVHGNVARAARICGLSRRSVTAKIAAYGIDRLRFKKA
jgi:DNA-binding NtrC family response regulator